MFKCKSLGLMPRPELAASVNTGKKVHQKSGAKMHQ
jgi:hypothetical protein